MNQENLKESYLDAMENVRRKACRSFSCSDCPLSLENPCLCYEHLNFKACTRLGTKTIRFFLSPLEERQGEI